MDLKRRISALIVFFTVVTMIQAGGKKKMKEFIVPVMENVPVIDGSFTAAEWADAIGFDGAEWQGKLVERQAQGYIGATEDAFYAAIVSEQPPKGTLKANIKRSSPELAHDDAMELFINPMPGVDKGITYQALWNSLGHVVYLNAVRGGYLQPENWNGHYKIKNGFSAGKWITELMVPVNSIVPGRKTTDGTWGISLCRDWKQPWQFSSMPADFVAKNTIFKFVKGAPAVQFQFTKDPFSKEVVCNVSIKNTSEQVVKVKLVMDLELDVMPAVRKSESLTIPAGKTLQYTFDGSSHSKNCGAFNLKMNVEWDGETIYQRNFKWANPRPVRWATMAKKALPFDFEFAYYPYRNLLRVRNLLKNYKGKLPETVAYQVKEKESGKTIAEFKVEAVHDLENEIVLPELDGTYELHMNVKGKVLAKSFIRKRYEWEHNNLGSSRKVYPPFTPMTVKDDVVRVVYRDYKLSNTGLPAQITAKGEALLAAPISFKLKVDGKDSSVSGTMTYAEKADDVVNVDVIMKHDVFSASAKARLEYDGCMKYDLTLNPTQGKTIDELVLEIPLNENLAPMIHAMGDGLRNTIYDYLKKGEGDVWNASSIKSSRMPENFCTYIFLGSPKRGLSFFVENDKNWSWNRETPNMSVVRDGGTLKLRVNLINKPLEITQDRTLSFGLQAAPIKPQMKDWRTKWDKEKFTLLGTCINWLGGPGSCGNVYPPGKDEYFWKMIAKANTQKVSRQEMDECIKRGQAYYEPFTDCKTMQDSWKRHVNYNVGGSRFLKSMIFYYNRAVYNGLDEYLTFMNEWVEPDFPTRNFVLSRGEIKIVPSKSYNDFALYWYAKSFKYRNKGVYWDNWFLHPSYNTEMTDAYYNVDGSITPATGLWGLRSLVKRTFQMMCEKGMTPITMPHMTSTNILPMLSFATVQYDWEWKYSTGDVQYRFSRPYTMLVSNGELAGVIPVMLHEHGKQVRDEWIQRTFAGVVLTHELISTGRGQVWKSLRDPLLDQYFEKNNLKVIRYWDKLNSVKTSSDACAWILYSLPVEKALLIICSYNKKDEELEFDLNLESLGLKANCFCTNFETGEKYDQQNGKIKLMLKSHELKAIEFSNTEKGK